MSLKVVLRLLSLMVSPILIGAGCGSGSAAVTTLADKGNSLGFRSLVSARSTATLPAGFFAPGLPYGTFLLADQAQLDAYWVRPSMSAFPKPVGNFLSKSFLAHTTQDSEIANSPSRVRRVSESQVIVSVCNPIAGVASVTQPQAGVLILEVDAKLTAPPAVEIELINC